MEKKIFVIGILFLFIFSLITPNVFGYNIIKTDSLEPQSIVINQFSMNHIWPMYKHDPQHTGRSPYDTSDNPGYEKWMFYIEDGSDSSVVIDKDGTLYTVSNGEKLYAVYPNGTLKWEQELQSSFPYELAIGNDGTIFIGTVCRFYGFYPNGTLRWTLDIGDEKNFVGYPTIDTNGTIYVGTADGYLYAIYPNGTLKWEFFINDNIRAPAVDKQGNIYFTFS